MKRFFCSVLSIVLLFVVFAKENPGIGIGADAAYPYIEKELEAINFKSDLLYTMSNADIKSLVNKSAEIEINIFELLDCMYRYLARRNYRVKILGSELQELNKEYFLDNGMVGRLFPIEKLDYIEAGAVFEKSDNAIDVYLLEKHSADLELGTGFYEKHFGFKKVEPLLFSKCFGIKVKANILNIRLSASKLELYDRGKGSFFVRGFYRGKHWYLDLIKKRAVQK